MRTIKGLVVVQAQVARDEAPFNTLEGLAGWAAAKGFKGGATWDRRPAGRDDEGLAVKTPDTFDCKFGFSTMGFEIAAGWAPPWQTPRARPSCSSATAPPG